MKFDTINVCQNAWFKYHGIKRSTFFSFKKMFLDGTHKVVNGNRGLKKYRPNTIEIVSNINMIAEKSSNKAPHLTRSMNLDGARAPLKLLSSNMSQGLLQKMSNEEMHHIGVSHVSQSTFSRVLSQFPREKKLVQWVHFYHILSSNKSLSNYLSIVHHKMDKSKTSIPKV